MSPNAYRGMHWGHKARARKAIKEAFDRWVEEANISNPLDLDSRKREAFHIEIHWDVYWGKGRNSKQDPDNIIAAMKYPQDLIAKWLGVDDRCFIPSPPNQYRDPDGNGYMICTLEVVGD